MDRAAPRPIPALVLLPTGSGFWHNPGMGKRLLRFFGMAEWGGDELFLVSLACAALAWALGSLVHPALALVALPPWLIVVYFFRDPDRVSPQEAGLLVAPADGTVTDIELLDEPRFLNARAWRVGIFLSPFNVHVNRVPCAGTAEYLRYCPGEFLPAYNAAAPTRNEAFEMGLLTPGGERIMVKQITGVLARRIVCPVQRGRTFLRGERYGMIKFGSRTELYVRADGGYEILAQLGQKVVGGETVLVRHVPQPAAAQEWTVSPAGAVTSSVERADT